MINHIHVDVCDSTQDLLKEQLSDGKQTILVSTNHQTKGRGRSANNWVEVPGSLCFSLSIPPHSVISMTALEMSLLIVRFFEFEGCKLQLKWPNDLWDSRGKKCAGVLVQGSGNIYYAGIGINLFSEQSEYGGVYRESFNFDKKSWSYRIAEYIISNRYTNSQDLKQDWERRCGHMGEPVRIIEGSNITEGIFLGLGNYGEARLQTIEGEKLLFNGSLRIISSDQ